jgi:hypothetical protein
MLITTPEFQWWSSYPIPNLNLPKPAHMIRGVVHDQKASGLPPDIVLTEFPFDYLLKIVTQPKLDSKDGK